MALVIVLVLSALLAYLAPKFGADTRESREWEYRGPDDRTPLRQ